MVFHKQTENQHQLFTYIKWTEYNIYALCMYMKKAAALGKVKCPEIHMKHPTLLEKAEQCY